MEGYAWHSEKKEREARGWRKKVQRAERKSASLPLDRLNSSKFIEPPSDGDDISDYVQLFRSVTFGQREGDNQRACFELSRARRRFLHPDRSLRRLMNGAAVWFVTGYVVLSRIKFKFESYGATWG